MLCAINLFIYVCMHAKICVNWVNDLSLSAVHDLRSTFQPHFPSVPWLVDKCDNFI